MRNTYQNVDVETDIYHAAAALRDGLNKAWSAGPRSLNEVLYKKYTYYPYFGGTVPRDVACRAMGHYTGWGDMARDAGNRDMKLIEGRWGVPLYFLPRK